MGAVIPNLRRLLVALLLACPGVVLAQPAAHAACTCTAGTIQESARAADVVFSGVLIDQSTGRTGEDDRRETTYEIEGETLYKGDLTTADVEVVSPQRPCGFGELRAEQRYVFFVGEDGASLTTDRCSGTARAADALVRKVERTLGSGTDLGRPQPPAEAEEAVFTKVADAEPESLTRLVAPGVALVLVGLLGLLVVRRRSVRD
jgi:hypothetical protein